VTDAAGKPARVLAGRYELEVKLGEGGMGEVWRARHVTLRSPVAVKLLRGSYADDEAMRTRFLHEARVTAQLRSAHAVQVFDFGISDDGEAFLAMELLDGESLGQRLRREQRLSRADTVAVVAQTARALDRAHGLGIVHRDLKPENLFLVEDDAGRVVTKVLDFGLAKITGDEGAQGDARSTSPAMAMTAPSALTRTGARMGTPYYMAPEQVEGAATLGPATDVWALGVVAYECLTGHRPFEAPNVPELFACIRAGTHPPARVFDGALPEAFDAWFDRACARDREARFPGAGEAARALAVALGVDAGAARVTDDVVSSRKPAGPSATELLRGLGNTGASPTALDGGVSRAETAPAAPSGARVSRRPRRALVLASLTAAALLASAVAVGVRQRHPAAAPSPLADPNAVLACPVLEGHGTGDDDGWLGAASATIACTRARWLLGGSDARLLFPQQLLDLPVDPGEDFPHAPFDAPDVRARSLAAARSRGAVLLDGTVTLTGYQPSVSLRLVRASDGATLATAEATAESLPGAVDDAVDRLAATRVLPRADRIDPAVSRFAFVPDVTAALFVDDLRYDVDPARACRALSAELPRLGAGAAETQDLCDVWAPEANVQAPAHVLDRSSPGALAATAADSPEARTKDGAAALARELAALREKEPTAFGRSELAGAEAELWLAAGDLDVARAAALVATREDPGNPRAWTSFNDVTTAVAHGDVAGLAASAWRPDDANLIQNAGPWSPEGPAERLREARRAFLLRPESLGGARLFGQALADNGRLAEARSMASLLATGPHHVTAPANAIWARVDAHEARFAAALERIRHPSPCEHLNTAVTEVGVLADLLGRSQDVGEEWAEWVLASDENAGCYDGNGEDLVFALVMHAKAPLARRALDAVAAHHGPQWDERSEDVLAGARLFAAGDARGAATAWAPVVASHLAHAVVVLPVAVFQSAGQGDLATRADLVIDRFPWLAGLPASAARDAQRLAASGDRAAAAAAAQKVVDTWGTADAPVPAVDAMRALVARAAPK
jgi:serine/threonine-protein kinase